MKYNIRKLEKELTEKIDNTSHMLKEKVTRYINLVKLYYELDKFIEEEGSVVITENGSQRFLKVNPAIQEKNKINTQILAIEKSFDFKIENSPPSDGSDLI
jgi:Phage terminase, small subunit.